MILKKPTLEKITPNFGASLLVKKHLEFLKTNTPFWHFHPEIELVYVNKGKGKKGEKGKREKGNRGKGK